MKSCVASFVLIVILFIGIALIAWGITIGDYPNGWITMLLGVVFITIFAHAALEPNRPE